MMPITILVDMGTTIYDGSHSFSDRHKNNEKEGIIGQVAKIIEKLGRPTSIKTGTQKKINLMLVLTGQ